MKSILAILITFLTLGVAAQTHTPNGTNLNFTGSVRHTGPLRLPKDTTGGTDTGQIAYKNGRVYYKDASGFYIGMAKLSDVGGSSNSNIGSGFRLAVPGTNNIKTLFFTSPLVGDSSSNTNGITVGINGLSSYGTSGQIPRSTGTGWEYFTPTYISNIGGLVSAGTNVTITGSGTSGSPYVVNSTGGTDSATVRNIVSDSVGTGSLYFTYATFINHGKFWEQDTSYTLCNWEGWVKVTRPSDLGYFILDGSGGQHVVLLGAISNSTHASITGNFYDGTTLHSMTSSDAFPLNEWVHIAFIYDGTNAKLLLNGIISHMTAFTGVRKYTAGGSNGYLYVGDNDHAPFPGQVKQVRGIEGSVGGVTGQNREIPRHFNEYMYDGSKASFFSDYSVRGTRSFVDRGTGFEGRSHHGSFSNGGELYDTYGEPQWRKGDVVKPTSAPTPASVPGSAKIFDSFSRRNKLFLFQEHGGLDSTEGGSEGKKAWATGYYLGGSTAAGIISGRAVLYTGQVNYAYVPTASQNADIRVDRGGDEFCTGVLARFQNSSNYYRVTATDTQISFVFVESGSTTYPSSFTVTGGWTTLRVVVNGTTMEVFTDGVSAGTKTIISNPSGTYHGISDCGQANWYDNFTIY